MAATDSNTVHVFKITGGEGSKSVFSAFGSYLPAYVSQEFSFAQFYLPDKNNNGKICRIKNGQLQVVNDQTHSMHLYMCPRIT